MAQQRVDRLGVIRAAVAVALVGWLAACAGSEPAPLVMKGGPPEAAMQAPPRSADRRITVRPGQQLGRIAETYHVPKRAIIAANHLQPPYKLAAGQKLVIPGSAGPTQIAAASPPSAPMGAPMGAPVAVVPLAAPSPVPTPLPGPLPPSGPPPVAAGRGSPEVIPLDGPAPPKPPPVAAAPMFVGPPPATMAPSLPPAPAPVAAVSHPPAASPPPVAARPSAEPSIADNIREDPAAASPPPRGGRFPWPVRGHVLTAYGVAAGGARNDGINIGAARGTAVSAVDSGIVAYAGNELRGYGNLVLIKHDNGWITAYAHCDELLVKKGDPVHRGQTIAKVGATGGVSEPQLHFELRRGKNPVDPREFLVPAPSADGGQNMPSG